MEEEKLYKEFAESGSYRLMKKKREMILWNIILTTIAVIFTVIILFSPSIKLSGEKYFTCVVKTVRESSNGSNSKISTEELNQRAEVNALIAYLLVDCPVDTYLKIKDVQIKASVQQKKDKNETGNLNNEDAHGNEVGNVEETLEMVQFTLKASELLSLIPPLATSVGIIQSDKEFEESLKVTAKNFGEEYSAELSLVDYCKLVVGESVYGIAFKGFKVGDVPFMFVSDPISIGYGVFMPAILFLCILFNFMFLCGSIIQFCTLKRLTFRKFAMYENSEAYDENHKKVKHMGYQIIIYLGNLAVYLIHFAFVGLALIHAKLGGYWDVFLSSLSCTPVFIFAIIVEVLAGIVAFFACHSKRYRWF